jgi:hypothetical protein
MKKLVLLLSLIGLFITCNAQIIPIKQAISKEPDTDLNREVIWLVMVEDLRNGHYELQFLCRILKANGNVLSEKIVHYHTSNNVKYKMVSATSWVKTKDQESPQWSDATYTEESTFFFNIMNKTIKAATDETLKKQIILNLDTIDKIFD